MNHYTLAEMTPGLTEEFTVTVTPEMMDAFRAITGDVSPIHIDADYARGRGFPVGVRLSAHNERRQLAKPIRSCGQKPRRGFCCCATPQCKHPPLQQLRRKSCPIPI